MEADAETWAVLEYVASRLEGSVDLASARWISRPAGKSEVGDATLALYLDGHRSADDVVVLISNPRHPHVVGEDVSAAREIRLRVGEELGERVICPRLAGDHQGRTFSVLPRLHTMTGNKVWKRLLRRSVARRVMSWSAEAAVRCRVPGPSDSQERERLFVAPLCHVRDDAGAMPELRSFAERALELVEEPGDAAGVGELFTTIEHGDFWVGNVLFGRRRLSLASHILSDFYLIDWRGARFDGYPCADVVRLCYSLWGAQSKRCGSLLASYRRRLGLSEIEMCLYTALSVGRLGMNLDHFPLARYHQLGRNLFTLLQTNGLTP